MCRNGHLCLGRACDSCWEMFVRCVNCPVTEQYHSARSEAVCYSYLLSSSLIKKRTLQRRKAIRKLFQAFRLRSWRTRAPAQEAENKTAQLTATCGAHMPPFRWAVQVDFGGSVIRRTLVEFSQTYSVRYIHSGWDPLIQTATMDQNEGIKIHSCRIIPALPVGRKTSGLSAKQGTPRNNDEHIYAFPMREGYSAEFVSAPERFCAPSVRVLLDTARVYVGIGPAVFAFSSHWPVSLLSSTVQLLRIVFRT